MNILLIAPRSDFPDHTPSSLRIPQMSLLILAELTSPEHQVAVIEEEIEALPRNESWDVVGITVMTATANRAYHLAGLYRSRGAKVIVGGVHPSTLPEEASRYADTVVVGEVEGVWGQILHDVEAGNLRKIYRDDAPDINKIPLIRYPGRGRCIPLTFDPLIASRGCPKGCEFCCVHKVYGRKFRRLPVERVVEQIRRRRSKRVIFLDDNLASDRAWALELFSRLKPYGLKIFAQLPVGFILDSELFHAAVSAGIKGIFVGVETIDEAGMVHFRKAVPEEGYAKAIRRCHDSRVLFHAALIFGMDFQKVDIFDRTLDFILKHSVPSVSAYVLTPYPGTALFERMMKEDRILHFNWSYYDHLTPVFRPAGMKFDELVEGYLRFRERLFSLKGILARFWAQLRIDPLTYLLSNMAFRHTTGLLREHYRRYFSWLESEKIGL